MFFVFGQNLDKTSRQYRNSKDFTFNMQIHSTVVYLTYSGTYNTYTFYIAKQHGYLALNKEQSEFYPGGHHK